MTMMQTSGGLGRFALAPTMARTALLGQLGPLNVRLVTTPEELDAAQALRYRIFAEEFGARFSAKNDTLRRDRDEFDPVCDHLIVIDREIYGSISEQIVGTYRMSCHRLGETQLSSVYSQTEFDCHAMMQRHPAATFLELGRSCVLPAYRGKRTIELLWQGVWAYCRRHDVNAMFGCASLPGVNAIAHALPLSFLHHYARAGDDWQVCALRDRFVSMDLMPAEAIDTKMALASLPALVKGYLRVGARFGTGAVVDPHFKTTDVMVVLPVDAINRRYVAHYGENAERFAA